MALVHTQNADNENQTPVGAANPLPVTLGVGGGLPSNANGVATQIGASSGNVANASAVATLAAAAGKTTYITGLQVSGSGATAGLPVTVTVAGLLGGTQSFTYAAASGALVANQPLNIQFPGGFAASAPNTAIVVTCPALGSGNTNNTVSAQGYQL